MLSTHSDGSFGSVLGILCAFTHTLGKETARHIMTAAPLCPTQKRPAKLSLQLLARCHAAGRAVWRFERHQQRAVRNMAGTADEGEGEDQGEAADAVADEDRPRHDGHPEDDSPIGEPCGFLSGLDSGNTIQHPLLGGVSRPRHDV